MPEMASFTNFAALSRFFSRHCRSITSARPYSALDECTSSQSTESNSSGKRWLSCKAEWATDPDFSGGANAYDILGVSQSSSFEEIKASFRKLAKQTHPDLVHSHIHSLDASKKFIQILAAYEILSDSHKRAHYDRHLFPEKTYTERNSQRKPIIYSYNSYGQAIEKIEVVEWLKWYRHAINDILSEKRLTYGSGYFDVLERDFCSALHLAYYGPAIECLDLLPNCFEAEVRSTPSTPEVLHLVSGRDLFGMVFLANRNPELSHTCGEMLKSSDLRFKRSADCMNLELQSDDDDIKDIQKQFTGINDHLFDSYRNLELHISGKVVAVATRVPPKCSDNTPDVDSEDKMHVYLTICEEQLHSKQMFHRDLHPDSSLRLGIPLGTIEGLGTSSEEGICNVYNNSGVKTHVIMKHRTLMVKHLHWYRVGEKISTYECRCSRARLPPSKFWLFEPRSATHDIGGWYVETFGRDKKGKIVPTQRCWDGLDTGEQYEERLHPAMYLLALAYRTLDIEDSRRRKRTIKDKIESNMLRILSWFKRLA